MFRAVAEERGSDCTYLFARGKWGVPALALPALKARASSGSPLSMISRLACTESAGRPSAAVRFLVIQ